MGPVRQALSRRRPDRRSDLTRSCSSAAPPVSPPCRKPLRASPARSPSRASTPMSAWPSALPFRAACSAATSKDIAAAGRHPAVSRHRDARRRLHQAHRPQHHHPDQARARCSPPPRTARPPLRSTSCRASARWPQYNKTLGRFQLDGIAPAPPRRAADRGHLRYRRQRHRARLRQGSGHRQGAADHHHRFLQPVQGRDREGRQAKPSSMPPRIRSARKRSMSVNAGRPDWSTRPRRPSPKWATSSALLTRARSNRSSRA